MHRDIDTEVLRVEEVMESVGFLSGNPLEVCDRPIAGLHYLYRPFYGPATGGGMALKTAPTPQHQYVSVATYEGRFVEAIIEVYTQPKDPKGRKRLVPLHCSIARDLETILARVNTVYPLPTP